MVVVLCSQHEVVRWPLELVVAPNVTLVDELARLQLAARRAGMSVRLEPMAPELWRLLDLVGLRTEMERQPERFEQVGVEERVEPADPSV